MGTADARTLVDAATVPETGTHRGDPASAPNPEAAGLFLTVLACLAPAIVAARWLLPERYGYDSDTIQRVARGEYIPADDNSYRYVGRIYGWLGLADHLWAAALLGGVVALAALYPALLAVRGRPGLGGYFLVGLYAVTAAVYLGQYSKDVWVLLVVVVVLTAPSGFRGEATIVGATLLYAAYLRSYWALILLTYVALRVVTYRALRPRAVLATMGAVVAGVTLLSPAVLGQSIQSFREAVNLDRVLSGDATTAITAPEVGSGLLAEVVENLVLLGGLVVPVPLALIGSPQYLVFAVAIAAVWFLFGRAVLVGSGRLLDGRPAWQADSRVVRAALFSVAVLTTQCLFEPDYGSYLRHLTSVLPLLIVAVVGSRAAGAAAPPPNGGPEPQVATDVVHSPAQLQEWREFPRNSMENARGAAWT